MSGRSGKIRELKKRKEEERRILNPIKVLLSFFKYVRSSAYRFSVHCRQRIISCGVIYRSLFFVTVIFFILLSIFFLRESNPSSTLAAGTVARTSSDSAASAFSNQKGKILKASDDTLIIIYQAGVESPNGLAFSRSADNGQTWSAGTQVDSSTDAFASAVILANDDIILTYAGQNSSYNNADYSVRVRRLTYDGVGKDWSVGGVITAVPTDATTGSSLASLAQDASGYLWISFRYTADSGTNWQIAAVRSVNPNDETSWGSVTNISAPNTSTEKAPTLVPFSTKLALIYSEYSGSRNIKWRWRNDADPEGTWQTEAVINGPDAQLSADYTEVSAVSNDSNQIGLLYTKNGRINYRRYTSSWSSATVLSSAVDSRPNIATDGTNMWAFWRTYVSPNNYKIIYRKYEGYWRSEVGFVVDNLSNSHISTVFKDSEYIPLIWAEGVASPYNIKFEKIAVLDTPVFNNSTPTDNAISWNWSSVAGATSYNLHGGTSPGQDNVIATGIDRAYTEPNLLPNTRYYRHLHAVNAFGAGAPSSEVSEWTLASPPQNPQATGGWDATNNYKVTVSWSTGGSQSSFRVYRNGPSGAGTLVYNSTGTSFVDANLSPNTTYTYYVYSVNGEGAENIENNQKTLVAQDSFNRPNQNGWGTADLGGDWIVPSSIKWYINGNIGEGNEDYSEGPYVNGSDLSDIEILSTVRTDSDFRNSAGLSARKSTIQNTHYTASLYIRDPDTTSGLVIQYLNNDVEITLSQEYKTISLDTDYKVRFRVEGRHIKAKIWQAAQPEQNYWDIVITNSALTTGKVGTYQEAWGTGFWDDYQVYRINTPSATTPPAAPTMNAPTNVTASSIQWNWSGVTGATGYRVYDASNNLITTTSENFFNEGGLNSNTSYTRYVRAYNANGEGASSGTASKYTLSSAFSVSADKNTNTWYRGGTNFSFQTTFGLNGVTSIQYAWGQNQNYSFSGSEPSWTTGNLGFSPASSGSYYVHLRGFNGEGISSGTRDLGPFRVDADNPSSFNLLTPPNNDWNNASPIFSWQSSSDASSGISKYRLYINGLSNQEVEPTLNSVSPTSGLSEGLNSWYVEAVDWAGNIASSENRLVKIDATNPDSQIVSIKGGEAFKKGDKVTISGNASDTGGAGVLKVEVSTDGGENWETAEGTNPWSYVWDINHASEHKIYSRAYDLAGNIEDQEEILKKSIVVIVNEEENLAEKTVGYLKVVTDMVKGTPQKTAELVEKDPVLATTALAVATAAGTVTAATASGVTASGWMIAVGNSIVFRAIYLFIILMQYLGIRKRPEKWGVVYNAVNKKPIGYAKVRLVGKVILTTITDKNGHFGFIAPKGDYKIEVIKDGFSFPSEYIISSLDQLYSSLYFGGVMRIKKENELLNMNIPLDPMYLKKVKRNIRVRLDMQLLKKIVSSFGTLTTIFGGAFAILLFYISRDINTALLLVFYLFILYINIKRIFLKKGMTPMGFILDARSGEPITSALIELFKEGKLVEMRLSLDGGGYNFFATPGEYLLKAKKENYAFAPHKIVVSEDNPYINENLYGEHHIGYEPK